LERLQHLREYMEVARKAKEIVSRLDPEVEVYVFGSVVEGRITGLSDIDLLIVSKKRELEYRVKVDVYGSIDAPVEIHFTTPEGYNRWYRRFVGKMIRV